jgi:putative ubiquitin-RnfH superfamily antitoxin RatB of RatAB toxin-antitoxin module
MAAIRVEVVYARPDRQRLLEVDLPAGATLAEAIDASGIRERFPRDDLDTGPVGIWGRIVSRDAPLGDGDRVEIYRPLVRDPREARRERARER